MHPRCFRDATWPPAWYSLPLHAALPIFLVALVERVGRALDDADRRGDVLAALARDEAAERLADLLRDAPRQVDRLPHRLRQDRKSTRLNSSHLVISYAVFCLKKTNHISR